MKPPLPLLILPLAVALASAGTIRGSIDLEEGTQRRGALRYGGADAAEMGPPAPFLGVVYLTGEAVRTTEPPGEPEVMSQRGLQFYPAVLPVQVGTSVAFPNEDNTYHNVFSYSPEKRFDLGRYAKDEEPPVVTFGEAGEVRIFCEVHEHMRAVVLVLETPYFTTTDADGNFVLEDVPEGDYALNIWRIKKDRETREVSVGEGTLEIAP